MLCVLLVAYIAVARWRAPVQTPPPGPMDAAITVPEALQNGPREWASRTLGRDATGYAVVLDPAGTRELVVERCTHRGYFDLERSEPRPTDWPFCESVLRGTIESMDTKGLTVRGPAIGVRHIAYRIEADADPPRLALDLGGTRVELAPGTRNDLYQRMDALPSIAAEHEAWLRSMAGADARPAS